MEPRCANTALDSDEGKNNGINNLHGSAYGGFLLYQERGRDRVVGSSIDAVCSKTAVGVKTMLDDRRRERRR